MENTNKNKFHCEQCNKFFSTKQRLESHYDTNLHKNGKKNYSCELCSFNTFDKTAYCTHMKSEKHLEKVHHNLLARNSIYREKIEKRKIERLKRREEKLKLEIQQEILEQEKNMKHKQFLHALQKEIDKRYKKKCKEFYQRLHDEWCAINNWITNNKYYFEEQYENSIYYKDDEWDFEEEYNCEFHDDMKYTHSIELNFDENHKLKDWKINQCTEDKDEEAMFESNIKTKWTSWDEYKERQELKELMAQE